MSPTILSLLLWLGPPAEDVEPPLAEPERVQVAPVADPDPSAGPSEIPAPSIEPASEPPAIVEPGERGRDRPAAVEPPNLHFHWEVDAPLLLGAGAIWLGTEMSVANLVPPEPRWTAATSADLRVREVGIWASPAIARRMSDVLAFGVAPAFGLTLTLVDVGRTRQWRWLHEDLIIVLESVAVAAMLTQAVKLSAARGRPYTYEVFDEGEIEELDHALVFEPDAYLSFPSGHANLAFAFVSSFATVATMRERKLAPYVWGFGVPLAGFVAYLRVAGHRHWFSDVVIGSTIGTIVGTGLPLLLHHPRFGVLAKLTARKQGRGQPAEVRLVPSARGVALIGRF